MFPMTVALERAARHFPGNTAMLEEDGRREDWATHVPAVARMAGALSALGLGPGDRYAILSPNSVAQASLIHAGYWSGRVPVPLNFRLASPELAAILRKCGARVLFVAPAFSGLAEALATGGWDGRCVTLGAESAGLAAAAPAIDAVAVTEADEAILLFTGGTTGEGKGVPLTHRNVVANGLQFATALGAVPGDLYLHVAPTFHSADLLGTAVTLAGGAHTYLAQPSPAAVVDAIEARGATLTMAPPVLLKGIVAQGLARGRALDRLRVFICGGAPVPLDLLAEAETQMPATAMVQGYGMTETAPILSFLHLPQARAVGADDPLKSSGKPLAGVEIQLLDPGPDGTGELAVRGPNVFAGYLDRPADTADAFEGGWFRTGDMARIDAHGFLHVVDRLKDVIITGGENVYSTEVETALLEHLSVAEAAVIGLPDANWGEKVVAVVVPTHGATPDPENLSVHCRQRLGGYKVPRDYRVVDALPKSALGKTLKAELRAMFTETPAI
jgi:long-chain acyl-CoA synthetase